MIKPVYTIPETAPMKFYRFLTKFGLPVGILINIINLVTHLGNHDLHWLDGIIMVARIVLMFFAIDGLRRMEWSGIRFLYAAVLLSLGYNIFFLLIYLVLSLPGLPSEAISGTISNSIIFLMYWVYFSKRRLLFSTVPSRNESPIHQESSENESSNTEAPPSEEAQIEEQVAEAAPPPAECTGAAQRDFPSKSSGKSRVSLSLPVFALLIAALFASCGIVGYFCYSTGYKSGYGVGNESGYESGHKAGYDEGHNKGYTDAESTYSKTIDGLRNEIVEYEDKTAHLQERLGILEDIYDERNDAWRFYTNYAVIVTTTGRKYHHYGCPHLDGRDFYIFNIDNAEYQGYTPCLDCWDE